MQGYKKQWNATLVKTLQLHLYLCTQYKTRKVQSLTNTAAGVKLWLLSPELLRKGAKSIKHGP